MFTVFHIALLAQRSEGFDLPPERAIFLSVAAGAVGLASLLGAFLPSSELVKYGDYVGTKNPVIARSLCILAALLFLPFALVAALTLFGISF